MKKKSAWTTLSLLGSAVSALALEVGEPAPKFNAPVTGGETMSLEALRGQWVVLYFYPKADTPGCTKEACSLRDGYADLQARGITLIGASMDDMEDQEAFKKKYNLPFPLIADPDGEVAKAYGVRGRVLPMAQRKTFIINPEGVIEYIFEKVDVGRHQEEVLTLVTKMQDMRSDMVEHGMDPTEYTNSPAVATAPASPEPTAPTLPEASEADRIIDPLPPTFTP